MRISIDLDGVICETRKDEQSYDDVAPLPGAIEKIQSLKAAGHEIIISTARNMESLHANIGAITAKQIPVIAKWLNKHNIPFDEIWLKPLAQCYLDDRAIHFSGNWRTITPAFLGIQLPKAIPPRSKIEAAGGTGWSAKEIAILQDIFAWVFPEEMPLYLPNRTVKSIREYAKRLKLRRQERKVTYPRAYNDIADGSYVSGLIDGEGCFSASIIERDGRFNCNPRFSIGLRIDDKEIIKWLSDYFDCGLYTEIYRIKSPVAKIAVNDLYNLMAKVIPHFEAFPLRAKKSKDYEIWKQMIFLQARSFRKDWDNFTRDEMFRLYHELKNNRKLKI